MEYRLDQLFDLQMGKTPSRNNPEYWDSDDHKWISIADLSKCGKFITDTKECLSDRAVVETGISLIPANTVVMSFKLSIGKVAITSEPMYSNEAIMSFRDKGVTELDPHYLYYLFAGKDWDAGTNKAVMGKTLNKATLSKIVVDIRPIEEQREVVRVLDKAQEIIEARQAQLQKLDELVKARFVEMFGDVADNPRGYEKAHLKDVAKGRLSYGANCSAIEYDGNTRYLRITDITDGGSLTGDAKSPSEINEKYLLFDGDILFARSGATVGKTYRYNKEDGRAIYAGYLIRLTPDTNRVLPDYIFWYTKTDYYTSFVANTQRAVAQPNINAQEYGSLDILVPPMEEQREFASFVAQVDKSGAAVRKALEEAQLLFDSLMQKYFG